MTQTPPDGAAGRPLGPPDGAAGRPLGPPDGAAGRSLGPPDGIVCFAGVDWWYHNRGHSECQVMIRMAKSTKVLWVNSIGMRTPVPGKSEIPFKRYLRKLKSTLRGLRKDPSGMWVLSPLFIPRFTPRVVRINGWLLRTQVGLVRRFLRMKRASTWITVPTAAPAVVDQRWERIVFNRSDEFSSFPEVDHDLIAGLERQLLAASDSVIYVNHELQDKERDAVRQSVFLGHGVDYDHFADAADRRSDDLRPARLADLPTPLIGFYGALDDFTVDLDLFVAVARAFPEATVVVIGPQAMDIDKMLAEPNVAYLGAIPYVELPEYAAWFDVGLMPWLQNDWIRRCNPIKLKEYLAIGFPVVSTPFPELEPYREVVRSAAGAEAFVAAVHEALADTSPESVTARRAMVEGETWDAVADRAGALLGF